MSDVLLRIEQLVPGADFDGYAETQAQWEDAGDPDHKPLPRPPYIRWKDPRPKPTWAALQGVTLPARAMPPTPEEVYEALRDKALGRAGADAKIASVDAKFAALKG